MTDVLLELSQHPLARSLASRAKLPIPLPERLEREAGATPERPLEDRAVLVGGQGALVDSVARTLARAGAQPLLADASLLERFVEPGEAYGRPARLVSDVADAGALGALLVDASGVSDAAALSLLYEAYHPWLSSLGHSSRALLLGRPPQGAKTTAEAAARQALDGFNRSVAKEIGGKGATANLLYVQPGAESRLSGPLRFFLSSASAFVTGQPLTVTKAVRWDGDDPWVQPLEGKVALVTGAARGIGAATAKCLAAEGAHVVCLDRPEEDDALSLTARDVGGSVLFADMLADDTPARVAEVLLERHGGVDLVIHNAGITRDRTLARMDRARWDQALGVNLEAVLRLTDALLDGVLRDAGRIVSLSSIAGIAGNNGQANYAASKAGIIGFTRHLASRLEKRGITVNAVAPGFIETQMTAAVPAVVRQAGRRLSALGQGGLPEDVARTIAFLCTPGAAGVTGQVLRVCGGALIGR